LLYHQSAQQTKNKERSIKGVLERKSADGLNQGEGRLNTGNHTRGGCKGQKPCGLTKTKERRKNKTQ